MEWEYRLVEFGSVASEKGRQDTMDELDRLGIGDAVPSGRNANGWELVSVVPIGPDVSGRFVGIMKREV